MLQKLASAITLSFCISGCSSPEKNILNSQSITFQGGYDCGKTKEKEFSAVSASVRASTKINTLFELDNKYGELEASLEALHKSILEPKQGALSGASPFIRYNYPAGDASFYVEAGAGPCYLSIKTHEQGKKGFNFIDQFGCGLKYTPTDELSLSLGYRFVHVSHAGLRDNPNKGINFHSINLGITIDF